MKSEMILAMHDSIHIFKWVIIPDATWFYGDFYDSSKEIDYSELMIFYTKF